MNLPPVRSDLNASNRRTAHLWLFAAGFLTVFVAMSLLLTNYVPAHGGILGCKLWRYYVLTIPEAFREAPLGPGSSTLSHLTETLAIHVLCSSLGGMVFLGAGRLMGKWRKRKGLGSAGA